MDRKKGVKDYDIAEAMVKYGGHFVQQLGKAFMFADANNQKRLKNAFADYWATYHGFAEKAKGGVRWLER